MAFRDALPNEFPFLVSVDADNRYVAGGVLADWIERNRGVWWP